MRQSKSCLLVKQLAFGAVVLLSASLVLGQSIQYGKLTGSVIDPNGEPLPGVTVTVSGDALVAGERTTTSSGNGSFVFLSLPPGTYSLAAAVQGFKSYARENLVIGTGSTIDVRVDMELGAIEETLIVTAQAPVIDRRSSTIDTVFSDQLLDKLPTARDTFYDLVLTAPGMGNAGAIAAEQPSMSAYGGATSENIFLVNGVNTTNPRGSSWGSKVTVNYSTIEEVKILSLGSTAEYGSFSGAAVDVLTKSGGNELHGDVSYFSILGSAADNQKSFASCDSGSFICADNNDDLTTAVDDDWEANLTLGGPILKDKLWFYAGYAKYHTDTDTPIFLPLKEYRADLFDLKLTAELGMNHRAWVAYHYGDASHGNASWGEWDPSMVFTQKEESSSLSAQYQWVISDYDIFSFKFLGFDTEQNPTNVPSTGRPGYINWWKLVPTSIGVGGEFPYVEGENSERQTLQVDVTHYAEDFLGEHEIKVGVQYTKGEGNSYNGYFHGYANFAYPSAWWYGDYGTGYWDMYNRQEHTNPWLTKREADSTGVFVDDQWVVNDSFTLNLGLRYDRMTAKYGEGLVYEMFDTPVDAANPTVLRTRQGTDNVYDFKTWSPRLGFAWTLTEDQKTVLRAHVGRYYAPIGVESLRRFGPDMDPSQHIYEFFHVPMDQVDLDGDGLISIEENRTATRLLAGLTPYDVQDWGSQDQSWNLQVAPGTKSPHTDQLNISLQRQLGNDYSIEASYVFKKTENLIALWPYNSVSGEDYQWEQVPYTTSTGMQTNVWSIVLADYNLDGATDWDDAVFVMNNNDFEARNMQDVAGQSADRTYKAFQLTFSKRYSNRWQAMASMVWADTDGVAPRTVDQNWYVDGPMIQDTPFGSSRNHFVNNLSGPLPMTPKFQLKLAGSYTIPWAETDFGFRLRHDSGRAVFPIETVPSYEEWMGDLDYAPGLILSTGDDRIVAGGAEWLPSTTIIDLSLSRTVTLGSLGEIWFSLDVLNAFNEGSPSKIGYGGDFGRVYALVAPRVTRLGLRFSF